MCCVGEILVLFWYFPPVMMGFGNPLSLNKIHLPRATGNGNSRTLQVPTFNPTSFLVLTIVGYLVGHQCNSRGYFTSEKCNVPNENFKHFSFA
jgi:hypothetical protein